MRIEIKTTPDQYVEAVMHPIFFFEKNRVFKGMVTDNRLHLITGKNGRGYISSAAFSYLMLSITTGICTNLVFWDYDPVYFKGFSWLILLVNNTLFLFSLYKYVRFKMLLSQIKNHPELKQYQLYL